MIGNVKSLSRIVNFLFNCPYIGARRNKIRLWRLRTMTMALQLFQQPLSTSLYSTSNITTSNSTPPQTFSVPKYEQFLSSNLFVSLPHYRRRRSRRTTGGLVFVGQEETRLGVPPTEVDQEEEQEEEDNDPSPQDLECVSQIKRVLELLSNNRDMLFNEVKLTVMIEDPREVERRRLLGIDDSEAPTRDDLAAALEEVNEGKIPKNRIALRMLAEEMILWPNLEVGAPKKKRGKSLYAKATDTGVDPEVAAKRLNIDWDTAANIEEVDVLDDTEVPSAVGYGALYLVTAFPVIIGFSVVLILFYNSLQ